MTGDENLASPMMSLYSSGSPSCSWSEFFEMKLPNITELWSPAGSFPASEMGTAALTKLETSEGGDTSHPHTLQRDDNHPVIAANDEDEELFLMQKDELPSGNFNPTLLDEVEELQMMGPGVDAAALGKNQSFAIPPAMVQQSSPRMNSSSLPPGPVRMIVLEQDGLTRAMLQIIRSCRESFGFRSIWHAPVPVGIIYERRLRRLCLSILVAFSLRSEELSQIVGQMLQFPNMIKLKILRTTARPVLLQVNVSLGENILTVGLLLAVEPVTHPQPQPQTNAEKIDLFQLISLEVDDFLMHILPVLNKLRNTGQVRLAVEERRGEMVHSLLYAPESSATNEETNNINVAVGLKSNDAKGGNSSSKKNGTICRWLKDHGIIYEVLEQQLFDKSVSPCTFMLARQFGSTRQCLEVGISSEKNHHVGISPALEAECSRGGMMQFFDQSGSPSTFMPAQQFGSTRQCLEVGISSEKNHAVGVSPALEAAECCRGGMMQHEDSPCPCEGHIPVTSATNEERNIVGLQKIDDIDAKGNSSEKSDTICRWQKDHGITREVLEQLFGKSRDSAAETLKVSTSTLKRACRDFGITRWPSYKEKRPNSSLNQKQHVQAVKKHKGNQSCPALPPKEATTTLHLPPEEATTTTFQGNSAMSVKVTYEDNTIRFPLPSSSTMKYLEEQLETRLKISLENFSIIYQDEEDDWISLSCDSDLMYGMDVLRSSGKTVVKMKIKPNFG